MMPITVPAHKLAYAPLPKAGCSTVKRMLAIVNPDVTLPRRRDWHQGLWHEIYPTLRFKPKQWLKLEEYYRFCVVRDPVKRLMSVYTNRVIQFEDLKNSRRLRRPENDDLTIHPDPDFFFTHLDRYKEAASVIKHHVLPANLFLGRDLGFFDRVYKTEEMSSLAQDIATRAGQDIDIARENRSDMKLELSDLKPSTIDVIRPRLEREYKYLGDYFDNPFD